MLQGCLVSYHVEVHAYTMRLGILTSATPQRTPTCTLATSVQILALPEMEAQL